MINFFGPANQLGVGIHNVNLAAAVERAGREICLIPPFGSVSIKDERVERWLANRAFFNPKNPSVMIFDTAFLTQFSGAPRIGFAVFETNGFSPVQLAAIKSCDVVMTPSKWAEIVLKEHGVDKPILVVNEGIDPEAFPIQAPLPDGADFRFVHVGKLEERKGTMQVIRCFYRALEREHATLTLHCENQFLQDGGRPELYELFNELGFGQASAAVFVKGGLRIHLTARIPNMADLYRQADCGIFPSRGEGWGLPIHECVASGVPAIVGVWSGQSEFLGDDYPMELALRKPKTEIAHDGIWFWGDRGTWQVPYDDEVEQKIRWAFENVRPIVRNSLEWKAKVSAVRKFTWDAAAKAFLQGVDIVRAK